MIFVRIACLKYLKKTPLKILGGVFLRQIIGAKLVTLLKGFKERTSVEIDILRQLSVKLE